MQALATRENKRSEMTSEISASQSPTPHSRETQDRVAPGSPREIVSVCSEARVSAATSQRAQTGRDTRPHTRKPNPSWRDPMKTTKSTSMVATCRGRTGISEATQRELMGHMRRCVRDKGEGHGGKSVDGGYCLSLEQ